MGRTAAKSQTARRRADGEMTRARVLEAAVETVLEKGYYQASSNEIARRAGVTWGAIQRHFGTREQLLLEVLNVRWRRLQQIVAEATVEGDTLEERLHSVLDMLALHYEEPEHLAHMEMLLDLAAAPETSETTRKAIRLHGAELQTAWKPLFEQALGDAAADAELVGYAFVTLRGFLQGSLVSGSISGRRATLRQRDLLVRGVACAIRDAVSETTNEARR